MGLCPEGWGALRGRVFSEVVGTLRGRVLSESWGALRGRVPSEGLGGLGKGLRLGERWEFLYWVGLCYLVLESEPIC